MQGEEGTHPECLIMYNMYKALMSFLKWNHTSIHILKLKIDDMETSCFIVFLKWNHWKLKHNSSNIVSS